MRRCNNLLLPLKIAKSESEKNTTEIILEKNTGQLRYYDGRVTEADMQTNNTADSSLYFNKDH